VPEGIVMARQGSIIALAFHPELTNDTRIHEMLIGMV
jgi:5'-phosphate synthase pdxT subunit